MSRFERHSTADGLVRAAGLRGGALIELGCRAGAFASVLLVFVPIILVPANGQVVLGQPPVETVQPLPCPPRTVRTASGKCEQIRTPPPEVHQCEGFGQHWSQIQPQAA